MTTQARHQYLIIGAGPAGLQLSYFLQQAGADYLTLEREDRPGGFFERYPRHRRLISLNKVHTTSTDPEIRLRWDWNSLLNDSGLLFPSYSRGGPAAAGEPVGRPSLARHLQLPGRRARLADQRGPRPPGLPAQHGTAPAGQQVGARGQMRRRPGRRLAGHQFAQPVEHLGGPFLGRPAQHPPL
ncbi:NAD(P)-binding domain-containing protein [Thermomonospora cellulosilytica]|uniref:Uncharacterized protein n=1 Tax=Thermomonospora cellulosilytica TaxID=1411118 RepID=A0A7W3R7L3_9ACTN|nr:NAD(P)-binding domain-containing protein [Thermomonospora cellulosilytica]MBA9002475.1 hypothetical protein [Thermomonospora cellulosilytica]